MCESQKFLTTTHTSGIRTLMRNELSTAQAAVLAELHRRNDSGEPLPTYRELCAQFRWSSTGTARDHLQALARKGYIQLSNGRARKIQILGSAAAVKRVPILGLVVAGLPVAATEAKQGSLPIPADWTNTGSHFAVRVAGDSMVGAGIFDGDYVVVRQTPRPNDGDVVVVTVDGDTTLKRLRQTRGQLRLMAENKRYAPIVVGDDRTVVVHGVVVGLLRSYHTEQPSGRSCRTSYRVTGLQGLKK